jgi:hypothetical protein
MPTVIDQLVVTLGLDASDFEKNKKRTEEDLDRARKNYERTSKEWEAANKRAQEAFRGVRNEIVKIGAAFLGLSALKRFTENIVTGAAASGYLARNVGVSTKTLTQWEGAADKLGGTAAGMADAFRAMSQVTPQTIFQGSPEAVEALTRVLGAAHVSMNRFASRSTDAEGRLLMLSEAFERLGPVSAQFWGRQIGLQEDAVTVLSRGPEALRAALAKQSYYVTDQQAKTDQQLLAQWRALMDRFRSIGLQMVNALAPPLMELVRQFQAWLLRPENVAAIMRSVRELAEWLRNFDFSAVRAELDAVAAAARAIAEALGGVKGVFESLKGAAVGTALGALVGGAPGAMLGGLLGFFEPEAEGWVKDRISKSDWLAKLAKRPGYAGSDAEALFGRPFVGPPAWLAPPPLPGRASTVSSASTVNIGTVVVNTQATDARGMARDVKSNLTRELSNVFQSNAGVHP